MAEENSNLPELKSEFQDKKKELSETRSKLSQLNQDKEKSFSELNELKKKIREKISSINALKKERDSLTDEVKKLKEERSKLNDEVREKATLKKEVEKKKEEVLSHGIKESPGKLKRMIEQMETKIETEVMPFDKEKELNKRIKELKEEYKKVAHLGEVWKEVNSTTADFSQKRRMAQQSHHNIQDKAQQSQQKHEAILKLYDEVKALREQEKPLSEKALQLKSEYEKLKKDLELQQKRTGELSKIFEAEQAKDFKVRVQEKTAEVKEKMKKGKKLSTEDILAFQASNE